MTLSFKYNKETWLTLGLSLLFVVLNGLLISKEFYYLNLVPWFLLIVLVAFYSVDLILLLVVFFTPLSINLSDLVTGLDADLHMPTEPLLAGIMLITLLKHFQGQGIDRKIMTHPVSIAIYLNLIWILITTITSSMFVVSLKFLIARIWFLIGFYFLATQLFKSTGNMRKYIWLYTLSMAIVVGIIFYKLSNYGFFNQKAAHNAVRPFFVDHTSYGAILALLAPVIAGFIFSDPKIKGFLRLVVIAVFAFLLMATLFSYTRAAWVSLIAALVIFILVKLKIKFAFLATVGFVVLLFIFSYWQEIVIKLEQNRQDSSKELAEHVKSISNVTTDASNLERLNRWSCAWRMFKERPVFGWGPGTYMFQYAPFQISRERTPISTDFANLGNAHSEYIGPLAESGFLGTITFIAIVVSTLITGFRVYRTQENRFIRTLSLTLLLGLISYYIHGMMNNFLDTDKASALFWGYTAMLVAMDVYHRQRSSKTSKIEISKSEINTK
jgi:putative inorganic carbon (HCO3(-)) transporter